MSNIRTRNLFLEIQEIINKIILKNVAAFRTICYIRTFIYELGIIYTIFLADKNDKVHFFCLVIVDRLTAAHLIPLAMKQSRIFFERARSNNASISELGGSFVDSQAAGILEGVLND